MITTQPTISIIIPAWNEEEYIAIVLNHISKNKGSNQIKEILVIDGESTDNTSSIAKQHGAKVISSAKGRAVQMNCGAKIASGDILYFLHSDTLPPKHFDVDIITAHKNKKMAGCFQLLFDNKSAFLQFFAWFTRFNFLICRGGDQSLFISKKLFQEIGGFNVQYLVYEDLEIIERILKKSNFTVLTSKIKTSTRRYVKRGMFILQWHFTIIHLKHFFGSDPKELYRYYKKYVTSMS